MDQTLFGDSQIPAPSALEEVFGAAEGQLADLAKNVSALSSAVKTAKSALQIGDVKQLQRTLTKLRSEVKEASSAIDGLGKVLLTDFEAPLAGGAFLAEVAAKAKERGLSGVRVMHGAVLSFPVVLNVTPGDLTIKIGKKSMPMLRPSAVVEHLEKRRKRKPPGAAKRLLEAIAAAYKELSGDRKMAVKIQDIYDALTRLPGQNKEYPLLDFVTDLYLLERSGVTSIADMKLSFANSTGVRGDSGAIRIVGEDGQPRVYSSLRFD